MCQFQWNLLMTFLEQCTLFSGKCTKIVSLQSLYWHIFAGILFHIKYLTEWNRVLLKKRTGPQLVKKFPAFYGTQGFITAVKSTYCQSLSQINPFHASPSHFLKIHFNIIHLFLGLPSGLFLSWVPTETPYAPLLLPYVPHVPRI